MPTVIRMRAMCPALMTLVLGASVTVFPLAGCDGNAKGAPTGGNGSGGTSPGTGGMVGAGSGGEAGASAGGMAGAGSGGTGQGGQGGQPIPDDVAEIMASYRSWTALSNAPVDISEQIASLCRLPTTAENEFVGSAHNRHALRDWANTGAATRFAAGGSEPFPVGAAIVKEKFVATSTGGPLVLAALGMMIKRAPGFDSASGDWEFIYWNEASGTTRGRAQLPNCTSCHASADATDFVFVDDAWRTASSP